MNEHRQSRRLFLYQAATTAVALPLLGLLKPNDALAAGLRPLTADNAQAKALKYSDDASKVTDSAHKAGSTCANCQFFTAATGACQLFPGYSVAAKGWCSAWAKKA